MNTHLDDHERRISHSLYGGLEGLDDNLMPRQGMIPRTIGKTDTFFLTYSLWLVRLLIAADHSVGFPAFRGGSQSDVKQWSITTVNIRKHSNQLHSKNSAMKQTNSRI